MLMAQRVTWLWCLCLSRKPLHRLRAWGSDAVPHRACDLQGQPLAVQDCASLRSRCARCDGGLRRVRRSPSRVTPLPRGPELSDDYWHAAEGWDRRSLVSEPRPRSGSLRAPTITTPQRPPPRRQGTHITTPPTQSTGGGRGAAPSGGCTSAPDGGNLISRRRPSSVYNTWPGAP